MPPKKKLSAGRVKTSRPRPDRSTGGRPPAGERPSIHGDTFEHTDEEHAFLRAVDAWKRANKKPFPLVSDYLAILKSLGYTRASQ